MNSYLSLLFLSRSSYTFALKLSVKSSLYIFNPNEFSKNRFGNTYERTLKEISAIEGALPAYLLSDLKMQQETQTGAFTPKSALAPVTPTTFESTPLPLPSLIKEGDVSNFSTFTSGTLTPNDDYSTIRVLTLSGGLRQLN